VLSAAPPERLARLLVALGVLGRRVVAPPAAVEGWPAARRAEAVLTVSASFAELARLAGMSARRWLGFRFPRSRRDTLFLSPASCFSTFFSRRLPDMSSVPHCGGIAALAERAWLGVIWPYVVTMGALLWLSTRGLHVPAQP
jgi:hypothetical protein